MDHSMDNPMWGTTSELGDDEILPTGGGAVCSNWPSPGCRTEGNASNDNHPPPSPFSEFFLSRNLLNIEQNHEIPPIFDAVADVVVQDGNSVDAVVDEHDVVDDISFSSTAPHPTEFGSTSNVDQRETNVGQASFFVPPVESSQFLVRGNVAREKSTKKVSNSLFVCDQCMFTSVDRHTFMVHKRSKHYGVKSFSCNDCSAKFTRSYSLKKHVLQKHQGYAPSPQLPKYCPFPGCRYVTRSANTMQIHKRSHQNASTYYCKQCNVRYSRRQSLLHHLTQYHSSNAALIGMILPDKLNEAGEATRHLEVEQVERPSTEMVVVAAEKSYNCDKCAFTSKNFLDVYRHKQSAQHVADDETSKNVCLYCHKNFASSNNLLTHIKKKHLESRKKQNETKKFFCSKCSFSTTRKKVLKAHEENSHVQLSTSNQNVYCSVTTPTKRKSPPKSDRNSVVSAESTFVASYVGHSLLGYQKDPLNVPTDVGFQSAACSSFCSFSSSASDAIPTVAPNNSSNGSAANVPNISSTDSFDDMASCVQHIQMANTHLMNLCRRRENELKDLRTNVVELLKRMHRNGSTIFGEKLFYSLEDVDQLVINAINDNLTL